tara:strand:- start:291 stop:422 length:132 start_codon:yes stop_codon:yes gene_type:complete
MSFTDKHKEKKLKWPGFNKGDNPKFDKKFEKQIKDNNNRYNLV